MGEFHKCSIEKFRGDALDSISFSPLKLSSRQSGEAHSSRHLNGSSSFLKTIEASTGSHTLHSYVQNPNKAIVTINVQTTEILTANKLASQLLGIKGDGEPQKLSDFILSPEDQYLFSEADLQPNGQLVLFSGKVMDLKTSGKDIVPVSVWARQLCTDHDYRCLVVMEPVERLTGKVKFDSTGKIVSWDQGFVALFGISESVWELNMNLMDLIPHVEFGKGQKPSVKQCLTGRTMDHSTFPLSIQISACSVTREEIEQDLRLGDKMDLYEGIVWVFSNISGLITLQPDGTIHSCNTNFSLILFGFSQNELVGQNITHLIPTFYDDIEFLDTDSIALPQFDDDDDSNAKCCASDGRTTADSIGADLPRPMNPMLRSAEPGERPDDFHNLALYSPYSDELSPAGCRSLTFDQESLLTPPNKLVDSVEIKDIDTRLDTPGKPAFDCDPIKNEELSASSSQYGSSSKHLSYSESQDTLHSCTNSITESDINANFFGAAESKDAPGELNTNIRLEEVNDYDSDVFDSESECEESNASEEDEDESESSDSDDESSDEEDSDCPEDACSPSSLGEASSSDANAEKPVGCPGINYSHSPTETGLKCQTVSTTISTPKDSCLKPLSDNSWQSIPEGDYVGFGRHKDGTKLAIEYYIKKVTLADGKCLYCLWVARDPNDILECSPVSKPHSAKSHTDQQELSSNKPSYTNSEKSSKPSTSSSTSQLEDSEYIEGPFSEHYTLVNHIRKGAFGCIKKAYRNSDGRLFIAKFIRKSEVYDDLWVFDNSLNKRVPLEVSILYTIDHPNIVKVYDVFQNERCFQMVMEKHGCGLDLFEFIERNPKMDEALSSYIFRQVVGALSYLHALSILHRDIKDENIIINEKFHVKLIDFGSATFMGDELFSTFCGTMEYCSPEVIQGNKYRGPELEMFALGITLYTLVFGENPYIGADEILKGEYDIPSKISTDLTDLIAKLLEPDPEKRKTLAEVEKDPWVNQPVDISQYKFSEVIKVSEEELNPAEYVDFLEDENELESSHGTDSDVSFLGEKLSAVELGTKCRSSSENEIESVF